MTRLIRTRTATTERIVLLARDYSVTVEIAVRGLELDATTIERLLHAPLGVLAENVTTAANSGTI